MKMKTTGLRQALLTALCGAGVGLATPVVAGLYELDGDATNVPNNGQYEADQIYCDSNPTDAYCTNLEQLGSGDTKFSGALVSSFKHDPFDSPDDNIFQKKVKDAVDPLNGWSWQTNKANDKNDITQAWAALKQDTVQGSPTEGHYFLHFGIAVNSEDGDASFGMWFNQNDIAPIENEKGMRVFSHGHKNGDVLVQGDLTIGGRIGRFDVFTWGTIPDPNGDFRNEPIAPSQGELTRQIKSTDCIDASKDARACATVNSVKVPPPWGDKYRPKGGDFGDDFPPSAYFEGELDLTSLFPGGLPCLGTFIAETRQSPSETASLEDFAQGSFDLCSIAISKTGPDKSKAGDDAKYTITIKNTGAIDMTKHSLSDTLLDDNTLNSLATGAGCDNLAPKASCSFDYTRTVQVGDPDPLTNTVSTTYRGPSNTENDQDSDEASHTVDLFQPSIAVDKKANGKDGPIRILQGEDVKYSITAYNKSSSDTPDLECKLTDTKLAIGTTNDKDGDVHTVHFTLASNSSQTVTKGKSASTDDLNKPGTYTNTATLECSPKGFSNELTVKDSVIVKVKQRELSISVDKDGDVFKKAGDSVNYSIKITNTSDTTNGSPVTLNKIYDDLVNGDPRSVTGASSDCPTGTNTLAIGASCTIKYSLTTAVGDTGDMNTVTVDASDEFANTATANSSHQVVLLNPALKVDESCTTPEVEVGDAVTFNTKVWNPGDTKLIVDIDTDVVLNGNKVGDNDLTAVLFGIIDGSCVFDDNAADGCLLLTTSLTATEAGTISSTTSALGRMPEITGLTNTVSAKDFDDCTITDPPGATRTLGFWKTHGSDGDRNEGDYGYTCHIFEKHLGGSMDLGWKAPQTCAEVFNLFWANPSSQDDGSRRDRVCKQTRYIQASWQLMAAILNTGLDNGAPAPMVDGQSAIELMKDALANGDRKAITSLLGVLGGYNESGDDEPIVDGDGTGISPADPNGTREEAANNAFGYSDCPE